MTGSLSVRRGIVDPDFWYVVQTRSLGYRWLAGPYSTQAEAEASMRSLRAEAAR